MPYYGMGDYYQGDYYQGDPFALPALGLLGGLAKKVLPGLVRKGLGVLRRPSTALARTVAGAAVGIPIVSAISRRVPGQAPGIPLPGGGRFRPTKILPGGAPAFLQGQRPAGYHWSEAAQDWVRNRRMNVTNVRALRRAIRRATGFAKLARRVLTFTSPRAPKGKALFKRKRR